MYALQYKQFIARPLAEVFAFFENPQNLARITPPSLAFKILTPPPLVMKAGLHIDYTLRVLGMKIAWTSEITRYDPPNRFVDEQRRGPYACWRHEHRFRRVDGGTEITDDVQYDLPYGAAGKWAHALFVKRDLEKIFEFRRCAVESIFAKMPASEVLSLNSDSNGNESEKGG